MLGADEGARLIAGGQTLVPLMAMRLARPTRLVDIGRIAALSFVREVDSALAIGATTRHAVVEDHPLVASRVPLIAKVVPWIGHAAIRARGTIGGSLAHADPAAEFALAAVTLDAILTVRDAAGETEIAAGDFFLGPMITALPVAACLAAVRFPVWDDGRIGVGFHEVSARRSDFAFASAAAQLALDADGVCRRLAVGLGAVTDCPIRLRRAEDELMGTRLAPSLIRSAIDGAIAEVEMASDLHASADYRRRAAATLATRAIIDAHAAAKGQALHAH